MSESDPHEAVTALFVIHGRFKTLLAASKGSLMAQRRIREDWLDDRTSDKNRFNPFQSGSDSLFSAILIPKDETMSEFAL